MIPPRKKKAWHRQEAKLAEDHGLRTPPGSGNGIEKGDGTGVTFCVQAKTTAASEFKLKLSEWRKTVSDARQEDRQPVMQVSLRDRVPLAVLSWDDFVDLAERAGVPI